MSTSKPATRTEFKEYCLRNLGKPVIEINVDDIQIEDCIEEAFKYYADYHYDGSQKLFTKHIVTAADITNEYIPVTSDVIGITRIFDIGFGNDNSGGIFSVQYQMALSDLHSISNFDFVSIVNYRQALELINTVIVGKQPIRFNRHVNRLYLDMDWTKVTEGKYLIIEIYSALDPETYTDMYNDRWLIRYTTALIKKRWGQNLSKFEGLTLPGGLTFNGLEIYNQANDEISQMEDEMINSFSMPLIDLIG